MREIKFRVWDVHFKTMYYPNAAWAFQVHNTGNLFYETGVDREDNYILQQFTGLKDKNGRDIYEGDLLIFKGENGLNTLYEVYYNQSAAGFKVKTKALYDKLIGPRQLSIEGMSMCEVAGNIFEYSDLCEQ